MTASAASSRVRFGRHAALSVLAAGLAGGAVDGVYASCVGLIHGRSVERVWQGVAGGWLGKSATDGGLATAALGLLTHFGIATGMAAVFALVAGRAQALYRRPLLAGALYGLVLYVVMYRIVLPLRWPAIFPRWDGAQSLADIGSHVGVGLAIALVLSRGRSAALNR